MILLLHGLGSNTKSLRPLQLYLKCKGYCSNMIEYPADTEDLDTCLDYVANIILDKYYNDEIIIIGQSMGGVIGSLLHSKNINVSYLITIGSPLKGASILTYLKELVPQFIQDIAYKPMYDNLIDMLDSETIIPPHDYHCITMSWPFTTFDGCVYKEEAKFDDINNTHLFFADHRTIFMNIRLWYTIGALIDNYQ